MNMKNVTQNNAKTLGDWAYLAIEKHFYKTIKYENDVLKDQDPENLHQMRVGMRRLRSAATGFAPALELPKPAQEKKIGQIARTLGELRDLDVLMAALTDQYAPISPKKERATLEAALTTLAKHRSTIFKKIKKTLKSDRYFHFKESLNQWLKEPTYKPLAVMDIYDVLPDLLLPEVNRFFLQAGWMVGATVTPGDGGFHIELDQEKVEQALTAEGRNLHNLRKQAKRVRYQMSLFTEFYDPDYQAYLADMKMIQDILGYIQDTEVLGATLTNVLGEKFDLVLPNLAAQLAATRYQLWQDWAPLRDRYLQPETRQGFRLTLLHPNSAIANHRQSQTAVENTTPEESLEGKTENGDESDRPSDTSD
ncbi:CHAD domain-containing protein [Planktothricoides raciborskii]|nr:CHAD domain-containing protein [Planktothricoides raciborskii]